MVETATNLARLSAPLAAPSALGRPSAGLKISPLAVERICTLGRITLESGVVLPEVAVAVQLTGPEEAPVVAVLGGISASRYVTGSASGAKGWWAEQVGPGRALDTEQRRVLCWDYLGGNGASTGPASAGHQGQAFTDVTTADQALILDRLLTHLGIERLAALVGASYGGMVALRFGALFPHRVRRLFVVSAAHRHAPTAVALRTLQRKMVEQSLATGDGLDGLALARALAMVTYRTPEEFCQRFGASREVPADPDASSAWQYLSARGAAYRSAMNPYAFLCLSRSIDLHALDPRTIGVPLTLVSVRQDQLVPPYLMTELAAETTVACTLHRIDSLCGHDAFLTEPALMHQLLLLLKEG